MITFLPNFLSDKWFRLLQNARIYTFPQFFKFHSPRKKNKTAQLVKAYHNSQVICCLGDPAKKENLPFLDLFLLCTEYRNWGKRNWRPSLTFVPLMLIGLLVLTQIFFVPSGFKVTDTFFRVLLPHFWQNVCKIIGKKIVTDYTINHNKMKGNGITKKC